MDTKSDRAKKRSTSRQTEPATTWLKKPISAEINRIAKHHGLTRSRTIATLLEEAVHQKLHIQHAVLLKPTITQAIAEERRRDRGRFAGLLAWIAVQTIQTRYLSTNILARLGRKEEITAETLNSIVDKSKRKARANIISRDPEMEELITAVERWLAKGEKEPEVPRKR
jgi:hypothetical protein